MNASWTNTLLIAGTLFLVNTIYVVWDVWRSRVEQGKAIDGMIKRKVELLDKSREVNATQAALIISLQDEAKEKQQEISKLEEYVETYKAIPMILRALGDREIDERSPGNTPGKPRTPNCYCSFCVSGCDRLAMAWLEQNDELRHTHNLLKRATSTKLEQPDGVEQVSVEHLFDSMGGDNG